MPKGNVSTSTNTKIPSGVAAVDQQAAALYIGATVRSLREWRLKGTGPQFFRLGESMNAAVRYRVQDLDLWMEQRIAATGGAA